MTRDPCATILILPVTNKQVDPLGDYAVIHGHFHIGRYDRSRRIVVVVLR